MSSPFLPSPEIDPASKFADPYILHGREAAPMDLRTAFDYCRFLYLQVVPMYRAAAGRVCGHFVTKLAYRGSGVGSSYEREQFSQFFTEEIGGMDALRGIGEEVWCYGNGLVRINFPFTRVLLDTRGGGMRTPALSAFHPDRITFDLQTMTYTVPDLAAVARAEAGAENKVVRLSFRDLPSKDFSRISIRILDPRYCLLLYSEMTGESQVQYRFTPEFRARIRRGNLFEVNRTPEDVLRLVRDGKDMLYNQGSVFHLKNHTISGVSNEGWGLPEILAHLPNIHRIAVLEKVDEAVGLEHMLPYRVLTPNFQGISDNMAAMAISNQWTQASVELFAEQRKDRTAVHSYPFPVQMVEMGGQGRQLAPKDLREHEIKNLLNCASVPIEFFNMSLSAQQWAPALRLFESSHGYFSGGLANCARWMVTKISNHMFGEPFDVTLESPKDTDDPEARALYSNLYSAGDIPRRLLLSGLTAEKPVDLKLERAKEDFEIQRSLAVLEKEEERRAQLGSIDAILEGQAQQQAQAGGGSPAVTPTDLRANAEQLAQQWLSIPGDGQRTQAMQQVRAANEDLYAVAKDIMDDIREQGASQGRAQTNQQYQQQGAGTS